ncbi:MAG: type II secretion system F family protein [bacterium]
MLEFILILGFFAVLAICFAAYGPLRTLVKRSGFREKEQVARRLEEMFIFISVESLHKVKWAVSFGCGLIGLLLSWEATPPVPFVVALMVALIGYFLPELVIIIMRVKRRRAFSEQLVDGLVMMANGMRAGFTLQQAIDMLIEEMPAPISQEFELIRREYRVGVDLDVALQNCVTRTKDADLDLAVSAIQITRQLGGNLAEVFERIVFMVRERKVLGGKADSLTAQGRLQALIVGLLPYVFGFFVWKVNPELMQTMWTTFYGFLALVLVVIMDVVGYIWVRKIAAVKY